MTRDASFAFQRWVPAFCLFKLAATEGRMQYHQAVNPIFISI